MGAQSGEKQREAAPHGGREGTRLPNLRHGALAQSAQQRHRALPQLGGAGGKVSNNHNYGYLGCCDSSFTARRTALVVSSTNLSPW